MPDLTTQPLWLNLAIFAGAAAVVWLAGVRIARWADALADKTGIGSAVLGLVLLGGITSLPEVAVAVTAAVQGTPALAVNNLLGGLAFQVAILAIADMFVGRDALTSVNANPVVMLQGTLDVLLLTIVAVAIGTGDIPVPFLGVGAWALALLPLYALSVYLVGSFRGEQSWKVARSRPESRGAGREVSPATGESRAEARQLSVRGLVARIAVAGGVILAAGAATTVSAEAIAEQTGIGTNFVGAVLLAGATSLPELSTAIEAVKLRNYTLAFADVFGTNLVDVVLILLVDAVADGPPVLAQLDRFSLVAALLGVLVTTIFLVGLLERRDRTIGKIGADSLAVLVVYAGGLALLWTLR